MPSQKNVPQKMNISLRASPRLMRVLDHLAEVYVASKDKETLALPYTITCAAALEARLNDALTEYAESAWRAGGERIRQALLTLSFRGKLETTAILLTKEEYRFNPDDEYVKRLHSLISYRNVLVHPKPSKHEVDTVMFRHPVFGLDVPMPGEDYLNVVNDLTFGAKNIYTPKEYHEALVKLEKWFFQRLPDRVSKVRLLLARSGA